MCRAYTDTSTQTTTPLADSGINDRLVKLRTALIDQTCFEFIDVSYLEFAVSVEYLCTSILNDVALYVEFKMQT